MERTDANGGTTAHEHGSYGELTKLRLPDGTRIQLEAAVHSVIQSLSNPVGPSDPPPPPSEEGEPFAFVPPELRVTTLIDRRGGRTVVETDSFGQPIRVVDPLGRVTLTERNEDGLVIRSSVPTGADGLDARVDTFVYDAAGNLLEEVEAAGTPDERLSLYTYEPTFNRLTSVVDPEGYITRYTYDDAGNMLTLTDPEGGVVTMEYDGRGLKLAETDPNGNRTLFGYDPQGNIVQMREARPLEAFNLTVDEFSTYFVAETAGADPVWVHNTCGRTMQIMERSRPNVGNHELQNIGDQLFRPEDQRPGGTAGELLR